MKFRITALMLILASFCAVSAEEIPENFKATQRTGDALFVYDLPNLQSPTAELESALRDALRYEGNEPIISKTDVVELPASPLRMQIPSKGASGKNKQEFPTCPGATLTASPAGGEVIRKQFITRYLACVFPYKAGFSVSLYVADRFTGIRGVCENKGIMNYLPNPNCDGYQYGVDKFLNAATKNLEAQFGGKNWKFSKQEVKPGFVNLLKS